MLLPPFESDTGRRPLDGRPGVRPADARPPRPADGRPSRPEGRTVRSDDDAVRPRPMVPPVPAGPRTTMAPFQAVPAPAAQPDKYSPERLAGVRSRRGDVAQPAAAPVAREPEQETAAASSTSPGKRSSRPPLPPRERAERSAGEDDERRGPWSTGPEVRIGRVSPPPPPSASYGDWTKPSRDQSGRGPARTPETTAIPERNAAGSRESRPDSEELEAVPSGKPAGKPAGQSASRSSGSPRVVGNRAALRAERQAADLERRKAARQAGERDSAPGRKRSGGRRAAVGLAAAAVIALGVLGVYSFTSPHTKVAAHTAATTPSAVPSSVAAASETLPPLVTDAQQPVVSSAAAPVKVPITVLNATTVNGLAGKLSGVFGGGGWQTTGVGAYKGGDVAATTVFFTQGDETQRQAAVQLVSQFPQLSGPAPRFFDVPGNPHPGLVVVAAGEWRP